MDDVTPSPLIHVDHLIVVTEKERLIFDLLLKVERYYGLETDVRVAGGWVRDKILGTDSKDIDIALHKMSGKCFCEKINEYLSSNGETKAVACVIPPKPEKNVEVVRMKLYGTWVDFVNLRADNEKGNGNEKTMRFGSAKEDAYLRDLTINSLFYNITNNAIEDFTGRGYDDLMHGKIKTPLPPMKTFLDDPLRVLRAIRFGTQFCFILDEELKTAAASDEVKVAIAKYIKRERIGYEVDLMISGKDPVKAMTYIYDLSLFSVVFTFSPNLELTLVQGLDRLCVTNMDVVANLLKLLDRCAFKDGDRRLVLYASLLLPLRKFTHRYKKSFEIPLVDYIFRDSLKLTMDDAKAVILIHKAAERFSSLIPYFISVKDMDSFEGDWVKDQIDIPSTSKLRAYAGLLLDEIKRLWRISLLVSTLLYPDAIDLAVYTNANYNLNERKQIFTTVEDKIIKLGLEEVGSGNLKPLVDGNAIIKALQLKSPSSLVSEWQRKVRQWQLTHPQATKEECVQWIEEAHSNQVRTPSCTESTVF